MGVKFKGFGTGFSGIVRVLPPAAVAAKFPGIAGWAASTEQQKIQAGDKEEFDFFGFSVSLSSDGNTAILGAYQEDSAADGAGAAYIFTRSGTTWTQFDKFLPSAEAGEEFGQSVSISNDGEAAIIGAPQAVVGDGRAYLFTVIEGNWFGQQIIVASDATIEDFFGVSVAMSGDGLTAIIGAIGQDTGGSKAGAAYIFTRSGEAWTEEQKIQASDKEADDFFGSAVSISDDGNTAIVSARLEDTGGSNAGAAYVFTRSGTTWTQQQKIQASDKEADDRFGYSVSMSGDSNTVIVGARAEDTGGSNAGAAYVFTRSGTTWTQQQKIQASDKEADDLFGYSVSLTSNGNTAIVGALFEDTGGSNAGAAYVFTRSGSTWTEQIKIQASDKEAFDSFGEAVAISDDGTTVIVGASGESTGASSAGAGYILISG